jgi:hypothetical protein
MRNLLRGLVIKKVDEVLTEVLQVEVKAKNQ